MHVLVLAPRALTARRFPVVWVPSFWTRHVKWGRPQRMRRLACQQLASLDACFATAWSALMHLARVAGGFALLMVALTAAVSATAPLRAFSEECTTSPELRAWSVSVSS